MFFFTSPANLPDRLIKLFHNCLWRRRPPSKAESLQAAQVEGEFQEETAGESCFFMSQVDGVADLPVSILEWEWEPVGEFKNKHNWTVNQFLFTVELGVWEGLGKVGGLTPKSSCFIFKPCCCFVEIKY